MKILKKKRFFEKINEHDFKDHLNKNIVNLDQMEKIAQANYIKQSKYTKKYNSIENDEHKFDPQDIEMPIKNEQIKSILKDKNLNDLKLKEF